MGGEQLDEEIKGRELVKMGDCGKKEHQTIEYRKEWEEIVELAQNMGFSLVPCDELRLQEGRSTSVKRKGGKREIKNLRFDVNYKDSAFRRETFNSK